MDFARLKHLPVWHRLALLCAVAGGAECLLLLGVRAVVKDSFTTDKGGVLPEMIPMFC